MIMITSLRTWRENGRERYEIAAQDYAKVMPSVNEGFTEGVRLPEVGSVFSGLRELAAYMWGGKGD